MYLNKANIVVLSSDYRFKIAIFESLKKDIHYKTDITALNLSAAQSKFVRNVPNILIIDIDSHKVELKFLQMLMEKYFLFIITVGMIPAFNDLKIQYVRKSTLFSTSESSAVIMLIIQKIKALLLKTPSITMRDSYSFVDVKQKVIAVGSSTGGTEALPKILPELPIDISPILIVQHMPSIFTKQLADRIDKMSVITVKEAQDGEFVKKGTAYIAPGDYHMKLIVRQQRLALSCFFGDKLHGVRPAADILFDSVAKISGENSIGVILTGMGSDGARGLVEMHKKGAAVIGQDKESCVVYGMPKVAFELGAVDYQLPLSKIAGKIIELSAS